MGAGQDADGVQLHRAEPPQQRGHAAATAARPEETLRAQREQPGLVGRNGQLGDWKDNARHKTRSLTGGTDIPAGSAAAAAPQRRPADRRELTGRAS
jgi:hypothetical protein